MPNWCQNRLTVEGPREQLDKLRDAVAAQSDEGEPLAFQISQIVLEPPEGDPRRIPSSTHQGGWDWYSWRVENWGSKWDVCDSKLAEDSDRLVYAFDSAWTPPAEGIRRISIAYPDLAFTLTWFEWGMVFYGQAELRNGDVTEIIDGKFSDDDFEYASDDAEEPEIIDPTLREFMQTHGFGTWA